MAAGTDVITVTDDNFEKEVETRSGLTLVDFWAEWCGPCRMVGPVIEDLAVTYAGQVAVGKLDVDANQQIATRFNVRSIPSVLFFKDGELVETVVGAFPRAHYATKIEQYL